MSLVPSNHGFYNRNYRSSNLTERLTQLGLFNADNIINSLYTLVFKSNQNALTKNVSKPLLEQAILNLYNKDLNKTPNLYLDLDDLNIVDTLKTKNLSTKKNTLLGRDILPNYETKPNHSITSSASLYDLLQVLIESSESGLTQVLSALSISLGNRVDLVTKNLNDRLINSGCTSEIINEYTKLDGTQTALNNVVINRLGYSELSISNLLNSTRTLPVWLESNEPRFRPATEHLLIGNLYEFIIEILYYQTGFDVDLYIEESLELKHLICSSFGLAITSSTPCLTPNPIAKEIPNVAILAAISGSASVIAEAREVGIQILAISPTANTKINLVSTESVIINILVNDLKSATTDIRFTIPIEGDINAVTTSKASVDIHINELDNVYELTVVSNLSNVQIESTSASLSAGLDIYLEPGSLVNVTDFSFVFPETQLNTAIADTTDITWSIISSDSNVSLVNQNTINPFINFGSNYTSDKVVVRLSFNKAPSLIYDDLTIFTRIEDVINIDRELSYIETTSPSFTVDSNTLTYWRSIPDLEDIFEFLDGNFFTWNSPTNTQYLTRYEVQLYKPDIGWETITSTVERKAKLPKQVYLISTEANELLKTEDNNYQLALETSNWSSINLIRIKSIYEFTWSYGLSQVIQLPNNNQGIALTSNVKLGALPKEFIRTVNISPINNLTFNAPLPTGFFEGGEDPNKNYIVRLRYRANPSEEWQQANISNFKGKITSLNITYTSNFNPSLNKEGFPVVEGTSHYNVFSLVVTYNNGTQTTTTSFGGAGYYTIGRVEFIDIIET
jgi:hypothetical protein